ncbi:MAG: MarR family winged helix-turn-helix transcriptional regulator [Christensenellales bacterium]
MITKNQAMEILEKIKNNRPNKFFNKLDDTEAGMRFVLIYLSENKAGVYASSIAEKMCISRARVAVLIQKLLIKGYIEKTLSKTDGRIEVLSLTAKGIEEINSHQEKILKNIMKIIEEIGLDEVNKFIEISSKIKNILEE